MMEDEQLDRTVDTVIQCLKWTAILLKATGKEIDLGTIQMPEGFHESMAYHKAADVCGLAIGLLADFDEERRARRTADK